VNHCVVGTISYELCCWTLRLTHYRMNRVFRFFGRSGCSFFNPQLC